ncbi:hypothetical protein SAMN04488516_11740 [Desulfonauticus submarinus]|uniref:Uncharacterized protein n=1 Tax=Desulfonauticus submarinus TaxID=206665 RepID=A0A1H0GC53_9BACT|nr:hypothetical protein [Desulfonauticus submarinus]SDO04443.1 hypothetical protein SAMN04488516_11740 [Desulfonauticus submarinus]
MIKLGKLILPPDLIMKEDICPIIANKEIAVDGTEVIFLQQNYNKKIDLIATKESGWIDSFQKKQLEQLAKKVEQYELIFYQKKMMVRFRYEDPPCLDLEPITPIVDAPQLEKYFGIIKLKEV